MIDSKDLAIKMAQSDPVNMKAVTDVMIAEAKANLEQKRLLWHTQRTERVKIAHDRFSRIASIKACRWHLVDLARVYGMEHVTLLGPIEL
jgi:hypothetical protein